MARARGGRGLSVSISVVIPCRDETPRLQRCLRALAAQDFPGPSYEVIMVDGGGDGARAAAEALGARVLADTGQGAAAARNLGVRASAGNIVAFTDADCAPRADWLTRVAEVFAEDPVLAGVAGALRMPRGTFLGRLEDDEARAFYRGLITSNVAYRRDVLLSVGGFDESLRCAEDYDLAWRIMEAGHRVVHDARPLVLHAPPEVEGSIAAYLHKQVWYARNDVPAHLRALRRELRGRDLAAPVAGVEALAALRDAALTAGVGLALLSGSRTTTALALGALAAGSVARLERVARATGARDEYAVRALVVALRRLARGAGTLAGYATLAAGGGLRATRAPSRVPASPGARAAPAAPRPA